MQDNSKFSQFFYAGFCTTVLYGMRSGGHCRSGGAGATGATRAMMVRNDQGISGIDKIFM